MQLNVIKCLTNTVLKVKIFLGGIIMKTFIVPQSSALTYMGRIDVSSPDKAGFFFAGSNVTLRFRGTAVSARIKNFRYYATSMLGFVLDGKEGKCEIAESYSVTDITLADGLDDTEHTLTLFKRQGGSHYFDLYGFEIEGEALEAVSLPELKIECFGDSVSAGEVCEAVEYTAQGDPEGHEGVYDNAWHSYPFITARNLGAQINDTAQGGIAIRDNTGWYHMPDCIGMESVYDKLRYFPEAEGGLSDWDFKRYIPDIVIFAVGQNDSHIEGQPDPDITDVSFRESWKESYKKIIRALREHYPDAFFVLTLTVLNHAPEWDTAIEEITNELSDERIKHFQFTRSGKATPGHPRLSEQYEMSEELTAFLVKELFTKK